MNHSQTVVNIGWLLDGSGAAMQPDMQLEVRAGRICAVNSRAGNEPLCSNGLDLSDHTVLPALIDSHVHLFMSATADPTVREHQLVGTYAELRATIARHLDQHFENGVVAVRDGGDRHGHALRYKQAITESAPLPVALKTAGRAWHASGRYGRLIGRSPGKGQSLSTAVAAALAPAVAIDHIKLVNSGLNSLKAFGHQTVPQFAPQEIRAVVKLARTSQLKVMVHANGVRPVREAVESGCDSIEHGFFMGPDNLKRMADHQATWVPTAITMKAYAEKLAPASAEAATALKNYEHQLEQIAFAKRSGVRIALGTDAGSLGVRHGYAVRQELEILMMAGFSLEEAVRCATYNGARLLGLDHLGTLTAGKTATFLAVPGPPEMLLQHMPQATLYSAGRRAKDNMS